MHYVRVYASVVVVVVVLYCIVKRQQALPELCRQRVYDDPGRGRNDPLVLSPQARPQPSPSPRVPAMFSAAAREEGSSGRRP